MNTDEIIDKKLLNKWGCNVDPDFQQCCNIIAFHHSENNEIPHQVNFIEILNILKKRNELKCDKCNEQLTCSNLNFIYPLPDKAFLKMKAESNTMQNESCSNLNESNTLQNESSISIEDDDNVKVVTRQINSDDEDASEKELDLQLSSHQNMEDSNEYLDYEDEESTDNVNIIQRKEKDPVLMNTNFYKIKTFTGVSKNTTHNYQLSILQPHHEVEFPYSNNQVEKEEDVLRNEGHFEYEQISTPNETLSNIQMSIRKLNGKNVPIIQNSMDPSYIGYLNILTATSPRTFDELSNFYFKTSQQVINAISNISVAEGKSVFCKYIRNNYIQFQCQKCAFLQIWVKNEYWTCTQYKNHQCIQNTKRHLTQYINAAIYSIGARYCKSSEGFQRVFSLVHHGCNRRRLQDRINEEHKKATGIMKRLDYWEIIPSYLEQNMANGGLSTLIYEDLTGNIVAFGMLPQYAVLLLKSECFQPVLLVDGVFLAGIGQGTLIIASITSGNRTAIPIGWVWGPSENSESVAMLFDMIKQVRENIETVISDESRAIISGVKQIFPLVNLQICAWHLSKNIPVKQRGLFWKLCKSEHPIEFMNYLTLLRKDNAAVYTKIASKGKRIFNRFYEKKPKNGLSSSPAESINSIVSNHRTEEPLQLFNLLEEIGFNRCLDLLELNAEHTPYFEKKIAEMIEKASKLNVEHVTGTSYKVYSGSSNCIFHVNTRLGTCDCCFLEDYGMPCAHLIAATSADQKYHYSTYTHAFYKTKSYKIALKHMRHVVPIEGLEKTPNIRPIKTYSKVIPKRRHLFGWERYKK